MTEETKLPERLGIGLGYPRSNFDAFIPKLVEHIDNHPVLRGWDARYKYLCFAHSDSRGMAFTNIPTNCGWWSVVFTEDDYHLFKLSARAKQVMLNNIIRNAVVSVDPASITQYVGYGTQPFQSMALVRAFKEVE